MSGYYLPGLNGFRAIAAAIVLIAHTLQYVGVEFLDSAAYFGVTIFFTLSGFLITLLLLKEREEASKISVIFFYIRRALRIWPLYFMFIFFTVALFRFIPTHPFSSLQLSYYFFFVPNYSTAYYMDIFFLKHYWSLGVEEQFYFIWPLLVSLFASRFFTFAVIFTLAYTGLKFFITNYYGESSSEYILINITRFSCMSIGCIGACLFQSKSKWPVLLKNRLIVIISWAILFFFFTGLWTGALIIQHELAAIAVVILILDQVSNPVLFNLENKFLNYIGKISFGIYIFHPLILILFSRAIGFDTTKTSPVAVGISAILLVPVITVLTSHLSYKYFEAPFLKLKNNFTIIKT